MLGARAPLTFGPFAGDFLQGALDVVAGTQIDQITMLRIGRSANIELFKYEAPGQRHDMPNTRINRATTSRSTSRTSRRPWSTWTRAGCSACSGRSR